MIVQALGHAVEPVLQRRGVDDHPLVVGFAHRRHGVVRRILEGPAEGGVEFARGEQGLQHLGDVAVGGLERARHALDHRLGGIVAHEVGRQLQRDVMRGGRLAGENVQRLAHLVIARAADDMAEEGLVAEVVPVGVELEQAVAAIQPHLVRTEPGDVGIQGHPHPGQDARQLLHVGLGVAGAHAHGVQLHDLAGVVLVDAAGGVLVVVEITQHGRMAQGGLQQVAETPQGPGPDGAVLIVADHGAHVAFVHVHAEMVHPEPGHLLLELIGRIEVAQQRSGDRVLAEVVHRLLVGRLGGGAGRGVLDLAGGLVLAVEAHGQGGQGLLGHRQGVDLGLGRGRQDVVRGRMKLRLQPALGADPGHLVGGRRRGAPGDPVQQRQIVGAQAGRRRGQGRVRGQTPGGDGRGGSAEPLKTGSGDQHLVASALPPAGNPSGGARSNYGIVGSAIGAGP